MKFNKQQGIDGETLNRWLASGAMLGTAHGFVLMGITRTHEPTPAAAFYAPDFFLESESPWLFYKEYRWATLTDLLSGLAALPAQSNGDWTWNAASLSKFSVAFHDLQREFENGTLEKGVPFAFERAHIPAAEPGGPAGMNSCRLTAALRSVLAYALDRAVLPYGFWSTDGSSSEGMLGCTPEILFHRRGDQVQTVAIAGTRLKGDGGRTPLMQDVKERREHQVVIDAIVSSLSGLGDVHKHATGVAHYPNLSHLKTPIELELHQAASFEELVKAMHPTPALGAWPRPAGRQWLKRMEGSNGFDRARFGAPFGALWGRDQQALCVVAIRNMQWRGSEAVVCAGCGVNGLSVFEREWEEINGKIRATRGLLGVAAEPGRVVTIAPAEPAPVTQKLETAA